MRERTRTLTVHLTWPLWAGLLAAGCGAIGDPRPDVEQIAGQALENNCDDGGDLPHRGAFTCELTVGPELNPAIAATEIERDRILMSHPGMRQKMLPIAFAGGGNLSMGGRYLFDTFRQADDYADFVLHRYVLDGVQFVDRNYFKAHDCRAWQVIGARDFADFRTHQVVVRTQRWSVPHGGPGAVKHLLRARWPDVRAAAAERGLTSVWLLWNRDERKVELVYYADRVAPPDPQAPDFASLGALAGSPPLGALFDDQQWTPDLDLTHWVFHIWQPFELGDQGAPSILPYSPPFPGLTCGDNLCVPSQGEDANTCPADCTAHCGDATCQPGEGETEHNCPGDCRVPSSPIQ